jgi:hypothetical protein
MSEPRVAIALLQSFCPDEALVGDILEEYDRRQSRLWLWRQVAVAVLFAFPYGMVRRSRRGRMHLPIGGLGLLSVIALITFVAPGAWWLIGIGIVGGVAVAGIMIAMGTSDRGRKPDTLSLK